MFRLTMQELLNINKIKTKKLKKIGEHFQFVRKPWMSEISWGGFVIFRPKVNEILNLGIFSVWINLNF
jgi:hypothetical protein